MTPELLVWTPELMQRGPGWPPAEGSVDSPLKVWDGSEWVPAGVKVED